MHTNLHINLHTKWRINLHTWLAAIEPRGDFRQCSVRDGLGRAGKFRREPSGSAAVQVANQGILRQFAQDVTDEDMGFLNTRRFIRRHAEAEFRRVFELAAAPASQADREQAELACGPNPFKNAL